jgi:type I restriction enzyme S subunit
MVLESSQFVAGLGHIPTDWRVKTADEISLKITKGTTPPKADIVELREIPFLRVNNLGFNGVLDQKSDFIFVSRNAHEGFLARSKAYPGDILMNIVGPPLGKVSLLGNDFAEYNMNQAIVIYRLQYDVIYRNYFLAYLLSDIAQQWLQSRSKKTSGQQNLTIELCKGLPVPIPAFVEQKKIAQILSTWDQAIATTERLLDLARQQRKALMQQLLIGKKRFPGFEGVWRNLPLCKMAEIIVSPVDKKTEPNEFAVELCNYTDVYYNHQITRKINFMRATATQAEIEKYTLKKDDVIITKDSETPGDIAVPALVAEDLNGVVCGYHLAIIRPENNCVDGAFLNYLFSMQKTRYYFFTLATGATRFGLSVGAINHAHFNIPSIDEQKKIASVLSVSDQEIDTLQSQLDGLKQEKKALMQALLTGKRRVQL